MSLDRVAREPGDRRTHGITALLLTLLVSSVLCVAIVELRNRYQHDTYYRFLDWNLFLAWIPVVFALGVFASARRGKRLVAWVLAVPWLLFFPNAPYLLTDFIHLQESPAVPLWYDGLMLSAFAWTALALGFASLFLMQSVVRAAAGTAASWLGVVAVLALGSFGVYIGRFIGFNSWDALLHPGRVADVIDHRVQSNPRLIGSMLALTGFLTVAYAVYYCFARLRLELDRPSRAQQPL
ncbi:MAG TPA: DUF1361 domain-containing protein [Gaiellaceae bacterium]